MKLFKRLTAIALAAILACSCMMMASCEQANNKLPIVCGETGMNDVAGVATYGVNYYSLGVKAGDMAADILLNGADVSTMSVQMDPNPTLTINETVASEIGFTIPEAVKAKATSAGVNTVTRVESAIVESGADFTVGILQLVQHVALDQSNKGFQDQLSVRMAEAGKTVTILDENASNEQSNNVTIAENFVAQKVDLIYTIATSSSQAAAAATEESKIPVLFNAVTDPVGAGLVASMEVPGGNVSGVSDINPVAQQVSLISELLETTDVKIGFLYTSAEANSKYQVDLGIAECEAKGYEYVEKGIGDINDIQAAFTALLAEGVDAIYIPTDNTLANGIATVHSVNMGE